MKTFTNCIFIIVALQLVWNLEGYCQEEFVKKEQKTYSVVVGNQLKIDNKYGDIEIRDWAENNVKIDAKIVIRNVSKQKADEMFKHVSIDISQEDGLIRISTRYDDEFFKLTDKHFVNDDKKFEVKYLIMLPSWLKVEAENKYGDVFVSKLTSPSVIRVKYGTLKINELLADNRDNMAEIDLAYSKGSIEKCRWMRIVSAYSKLEIDESQALVAVTKYSKLSVNHGSSLICESKYDTYVIGTISNFVIESQYSNLKIDELKKNLKLDTRYTDSKVGYIAAGFDAIEIDNSYGSIRLGIDPSSSYFIDGFARYARIVFSGESNVNREQDNNEMSVKGYIGKDRNTKSKVTIDTNYGSVNISL